MGGRSGNQHPRNHAAATFVAIGLVAALVLFHGEGSVNDSEAFVSTPSVQFLRRADVNHRLPEPLRASPNAHMLRDVDNVGHPGRNRPPWIHPSLLNRITRMNKEGVKTTFQVWHRESTIIPSMIGHTIAVHNGRDHILSQSRRAWWATRSKTSCPLTPSRDTPRGQRRRSTVAVRSEVATSCRLRLCELGCPHGQGILLACISVRSGTPD